MQDDLLRTVVTTLDRLGIRHFVTGSMATIVYGEPRFTNDIDVVVDLPADRIDELVAAFPAPEFYVDDEAVRRAVEQHGQFNIIQPRRGLKVDMMVTALGPFDRSRFARRREVHVAPDLVARFASPEDVILKKLVFYRDGGSDKHLRDVAGVLRVSGAGLDRAYLAEWAAELGVAELWREVQRLTETSG